MVRSEAIRTVKLALEAADMDMPEPIYRVQLSERAELAAAPPAPPRPPRAPSTTAPVDTRVIDDLTRQIAAEPKSRSAPDLLDPSAPKE